MNKIKSQINRIFIQLPKLATALAGHSYPRASFLYFKFLYFSISRKSLLKNKPLNFKFYFNKRRFSLDLLNNLDIAVLVEIFVLKEYDWTPSNFDGAKNILDLGAHWGDTALFYALKFPSAQIISVEPMPETYSRLKYVTEQFKNVLTQQGALDEVTKKVTFYVSENSVGNSLLKREQSTSAIKVQTITIDEILKKFNVAKFDLVKFDIEGAETVIFNYENLPNFSDAYIGEIHLDLIDTTLDDIKSKFIGFNVDFKYLKNNRYILTAEKI